MHRIRSWARAKARDPSNNSTISHAEKESTAYESTTTKNSPPIPSLKTGENTLVLKDDEVKKNVATGFWLTGKSILFSSYLNILLIFVPAGVTAHFANLNPGIIFGINAIAIVPLAGLLSFATESIATRMGDTVGALMNVTFGNAVELIIFIIALHKGELRIVQASLLGSILANLLLILGMCFFIGGLKYREQIYNNNVTQMSSCLLSLSVMSLLLPTAFHASFDKMQESKATIAVLKISRGTSVVLLMIYGMYLLFQLKSHAYMYKSTPQHIIDEEAVPGPVAAWMEHSSAQFSASSSDSEASGFSHITARRVKRIVRRHTRRTRSRCGSKEFHDLSHHPDLNSRLSASIISVPTDREVYPSIYVTDAPNSNNDDEHVYTPIITRQISIYEDTNRPKRDQSRKRRPKSRKCSINTNPDDSITVIDESRKMIEGTVKPAQDNAVQAVMEASKDTAEANSAPKRPYLRLKTFRPNIPKSFSQNVFTQPYPDSNALNYENSPYARAPCICRRTISLPDRLDLPRTINTEDEHHKRLDPINLNDVSDLIPDNPEKKNHISRNTAVFLLLISTISVATCAEFMVDSINSVVQSDSGLSEAFIGLIILPIVGNAAEHITAVTVAAKNKMDLAIGVAIGSSIQIALFVTPFVVLLAWCMNKDLSLFFTLFETVSLFISTLIVNFLILDGRSNYLEGALLCAAYVMITVAAYYYPNIQDSSNQGGVGDSTINMVKSSMGFITRLS